MKVAYLQHGAPASLWSLLDGWSSIKGNRYCTRATGFYNPHKSSDVNKTDSKLCEGRKKRGERRMSNESKMWPRIVKNGDKTRSGIAAGELLVFTEEKSPT